MFTVQENVVYYSEQNLNIEPEVLKTLNMRHVHRVCD